MSSRKSDNIEGSGAEFLVIGGVRLTDGVWGYHITNSSEKPQLSY